MYPLLLNRPMKKSKKPRKSNDPKRLPNHQSRMISNLRNRPKNQKMSKRKIKVKIRIRSKKMKNKKNKSKNKKKSKMKRNRNKSKKSSKMTKMARFPGSNRMPKTVTTSKTKKKMMMK